MKRIFFCIIILLAGMSSVSAQSEMPADTVRTAVRGEASPEGMSPSEKELLPDVKNYDGFLLDMGLMHLSTPTLPKFALEIPDASKDYSRIFQLNPNVTYSQGLSNIFSLSNSRYFSSNPCASRRTANMTRTAGKCPTLPHCLGKRTISKGRSS